MKRIPRLLAAAVCMAAGHAATAFAEGDGANGRKLATQWSCTHCHGADGNARSTKFQPVPMLAGQPESYLAQEMRNYISGVRADSSQNAFMSKNLKQISDQDIEDLAAFFAAQKRY